MSRVEYRCEACAGPATRTCGLGDMPMLAFCDEHYAWHVREVHDETAPERPLRRLAHPELFTIICKACGSHLGGVNVVSAHKGVQVRVVCPACGEWEFA